MKKLFDELSYEISKRVTQKYSTSFSLGILALSPAVRPAIYAIYGYVRLADEIVDSFHDYDKKTLLERFRQETNRALEERISLNPILQSFQETVSRYSIDKALIGQFLYSMEMDLNNIAYTKELYNKYIYGSAEVVGLMCLQVFTGGNKKDYELLKPYAMKLGSAFQKVNFLRDIKDDYHRLGRSYFPTIQIHPFNSRCKYQIEQEIEMELTEALTGIRMLPRSSKFGVYLAYRYYRTLFKKIKTTPAEKMFERRVRLPNIEKMVVMIRSYIRYKAATL